MQRFKFGLRLKIIFFACSIALLLSAINAFLSNFQEFIILIIILICAGYYFGSRIIEPIEKLRSAANEVIKGNLDYKIQIKTGDEIGDLASIYNEMIAHLKEKHNKLLGQINDRLKTEEELKKLTKSLDETIKKRTFDLENLNRASINLLEDLTESKTKLEKYSKDLEIALKVKSDFTATVSHELRTPLAAIKEGIGVVIDGIAGEPNKEQKEFLEIARRNVDRLSRLINNVLDFQKLEAGKMAMKFKKHEINSILRDAFSSSENLAKKKGIGFNLNLFENPFEAELDRDRLMQVLVNLIDNGIKNTDQGSISISASLSDNKVKISVKDTGHGIRAEDMPKLFEKYAQVERKPGGTGLGLSISKAIIEAHGGKIWVDSQFGEGSDFQFTLPVSQEKVHLG